MFVIDTSLPSAAAAAPTPPRSASLLVKAPSCCTWAEILLLVELKLSLLPNSLFSDWISFKLGVTGILRWSLLNYLWVAFAWALKPPMNPLFDDPFFSPLAVVLAAFCRNLDLCVCTDSLSNFEDTLFSLLLFCDKAWSLNGVTAFPVGVNLAKASSSILPVSAL